jgi:hypothetical protein
MRRRSGVGEERDHEQMQMGGMDLLFARVTARLLSDASRGSEGHGNARLR